MEKEGDPSQLRENLLDFLLAEVFTPGANVHTRLNAIKHCHLMIDAKANISQSTILKLLLRVVDTELDTPVVRGVPLCLKHQVFQHSDLVVELLQKLLCIHDENIRKNTLTLIEGRKWVSLVLVDRMLQASAASTYLCKVSVCELLAISFRNPGACLASEDDAEARLIKAFDLYANLCQDPIPMVRIAAVAQHEIVCDAFRNDAGRLKHLVEVSRVWILHDHDQKVRAVAAEHGLPNLTPEEIVQGVETEELPWFVTEKIAQQLPHIIQRIPNKCDIDRLANLFYQPESCVRIAAVENLHVFITPAEVHLASWKRLYTDAMPVVREAMIRKTPSILPMLNGMPEPFDKVKEAFFILLTTDTNPEVRALAIRVFFQDCIEYYTPLSEPRIAVLYESVCAFTASWKPLHAGVKAISLALRHKHPEALVTKLWTDAISQHVAFLRDEAIVELRSFQRHFGNSWLQATLVPLIQEIAETTPRRLVAKSCRDALQVANDLQIEE